MSYRVADYRDYQAEEGIGAWKMGVLNIKTEKWNNFTHVIDKLMHFGDFIWRGQKKDWKLQSKFDRIVESDRDKRLEEHKEFFVRAIRGRRGVNPPEITDDDLWSLGQHYGLATPLLDWTESPFVAAYFAFCEQSFGSSQEHSSRFVYGLSKDIGRWGPSNSPGEKPYDFYIRFVEPLSDENPRLINQGGLFTCALFKEVDIESIVKWCYTNDTAKKKNRMIFVRIGVSECEREKSLRSLNAMNINHATLFPDLAGAAEYCNVKLEIERY